MDVLNNSSNFMPLLESREIFVIACCVIFNIVSTALENSMPEYVLIHNEYGFVEEDCFLI